ncbi:MAG TPA: hypothetical protein VEW03_15450 [Longimicrobiaceae bacterium]|nr:hypothetical protein [Longimicrobiaceae bacterium]
MTRLLLAPCALLLCTAPLAAQSTAPATTQKSDALAPGCTREAVRPLRGSEAARDSIRRALRRAVREDAIASARAAGVAEPSGLFLLLFDRRNPATGSFRSFGGNVPAAVLQGVFDRAASRLTAWPDRGDAELNVRLDADGEPPEPAPGTERVECEPQLENRPEITRLMQQFAQDDATMAMGRGVQAVSLYMLLSRDGEVVYADLVRTSSDSRLDAFALSLAPRLKLRVASVDGRAVDTWVTLPIALGDPGQRRP